MRDFNWAPIEPEHHQDGARTSEPLEHIARELERIADALKSIDLRLTTDGNGDIADLLDETLTHTTKRGSRYGIAEALGDVTTAIYDAGN